MGAYQGTRFASASQPREGEETPFRIEPLPSIALDFRSRLW
jgi:hypothetical protein